MPFVWIVVTNVLRRKLRSALTATAIMLAVATTVALISFAQGLQQSSLDTYRGHGVDLVVLRAGVTQRLTSNLEEAIGQRLEKLPGVAAVNPSLTDMVSFGQGDLLGIPLQGWLAEGFAAKTLRIVQGRALAADDNDAVVFGRALAEGLKKNVLDSVEIENAKFQVVGIYEGTNFFENATAVVPLRTLQELMERPGQVTEFQIALEPDLGDPHATIANLRQRINALKDDESISLGLEAIPTEEYITSSSEIRLASILANVGSSIALVLGAIGILNTMVMTVMERTHEIGALRAIGWRRSRVLRMIVGESLLLSLAGAVAGIIAAALLLRVVSQAPAVRGWIVPELKPSVALEGLLLAMLMAVTGALYPAYRGTRCSPAEALRHE